MRFSDDVFLLLWRAVWHDAQVIPSSTKLHGAWMLVFMRKVCVITALLSH